MSAVGFQYKYLVICYGGKLWTIVVLVLTVSLMGCAKKEPLKEASQTAVTDEPASSDSGDPVDLKEKSAYSSELFESVKTAVNCSPDEAEELITEIEEIINCKVTSIEVYSIAELPENVRRIIEVSTPNEGERYLVSIAKDHKVLKAVLKQSNVVIYDVENGIDMRTDDIK